jgi:hypothetical protein
MSAGTWISRTLSLACRLGGLVEVRGNIQRHSPVQAKQSQELDMLRGNTSCVVPDFHLQFLCCGIGSQVCAIREVCGYFVHALRDIITLLKFVHVLPTPALLQHASAPPPTLITLVHGTRNGF